MALFSWFNSSDHIDTALVWVSIIGAIIEIGVAVIAVINVHKEFEESRKKTIERYIEIFACIAAFFFLAEAILGWRSSALLAIELEGFKTENAQLVANNLVLRSNVVALEKEQLPMTVGDVPAFIRMIPPVTNITVLVTNTLADERSHTTSFELYQALRSAGWTVQNNLADRPIGVRIKYDGDSTSANTPTVNAANLIHKAFSEMNVPAVVYPGHETDLTASNTIVIDVEQRPDHNNYEQMLASAKEYDAITDFSHYRDFEISTNPTPEQTNRLYELRQTIGKTMFNAAIVYKNYSSIPTNSNAIYLLPVYNGQNGALQEMFAYLNGVPVGVYDPPCRCTFTNGVLLNLEVQDLRPNP